MDYTGLGRFTAYKINRPLTKEERKARLDPKKPASSDPIDWMSVIKVNSTYLELVDRWYAIRGYASWIGLLVFLPPFVSLFIVVWLAIGRNEVDIWIFVILAIPVLSIISYFGLYAISLDAFRNTHYPIRLNRKSRQVYAFRPDGTIIKTDWDSLFICAVTVGGSLATSTEDIRANVLGEDGETVLDTFTLGYPYLGDKNGSMQLWEYVRRYMEEPDGVALNYKSTKICPPIDGRREGIKFGLIATFAPTVKWPIKGQLLFSWAHSIAALGRWLAMYTCKVPQWPEEIEAECQIHPDDPCQKDWRSNGEYGFREFEWPLICFLIGIAVLAVGGYWFSRELFL